MSDDPNIRLVRPGEIKPSIADHNLDPAHGVSRAMAVRDGGMDGDGVERVEGDVEGSGERRGSDRPFPAAVLIAPGCFALLVAAMADEIAARNGWGTGIAMVIAVAGGLVGAACFGVLGQRADGESGRVLGPLAVGLSTLVAGTTLMRLV